MRVRLCSALFTVVYAIVPAPVAAQEVLPRLAAAADRTTVSGISSGGYMAVQFQVAHSRTVRGAGVLAAGPYYCARGNALRARHACMNPSLVWPLPDVRTLQAVARSLAQAQRIDSTNYLRDDRVWLFSGRADETVTREVVESLRAWYLGFVPAEQIRMVDGVDAGHAMVTADYGQPCDMTAAPYLNDCDFDAAGALLSHLHGPLEPPTAAPSGRLVRFEQREFTPSPYGISMDDGGYVYVPDACRAGGCGVHVAFHGCRQGAHEIGDAFVVHAGYNRWADANRLVVLYPQAIARCGWGPWPLPTTFVYNPKGCWDWWGYTGAGYHTRTGAQIQAVANMLERLQAPR